MVHVAVFPLRVADLYRLPRKLDQLLARILYGPDAKLRLGERLKLLADCAKRLRLLRVRDVDAPSVRVVNDVEVPAVQRRRIRLWPRELPVYLPQLLVGENVAKLFKRFL